MNPDRRAGRGVKGFDQAHCVWDKCDTVDYHGGCDVVARKPLIGIKQGVVRIEGRAAPSYLEVGDIAGLNIDQRRIFGVADVTSIGLPIAVLSA